MNAPAHDALIIIDMQIDYFVHPELQAVREKLCESINKLTRSARDNNVPIIWVRSEFAADLSDAFLEMLRKNISVVITGTPGSCLLPELEVDDDDLEMIKKRYSAFFNTELEMTLNEMKCERVLIAGINSHACVRTSAIDAYQMDYDVYLVDECIASYDQAHHKVTMDYLESRIGTVIKLAEVSALLR